MGVATDSSHARIRELNPSAPDGLAISQVPGLSLYWLSQVSRSRRWASCPTTRIFLAPPTELLSPSVAAAAFGFITRKYSHFALCPNPTLLTTSESGYILSVRTAPLRLHLAWLDWLDTPI